MNLLEIPTVPPPRLTEKEVLEISKLSKGQLATRKAKGLFPKKLYWSREGNVYNGAAVYKALGYTVEMQSDPFL